MYRPLATTVALCLLAPIASAAPIVDGVLGTGEYSNPPVQVNYNPNAPLGNFGSPTNENHNVAYNIYLKSDANFVYGLVKADLARGGAVNGLVFANLYFDTNPLTASGSDLGFEIGANGVNAFKPGFPINGNPANDGFLFATSGDGVEFALPISYLQTDPDNIGFQRIGPGNSLLRLNLSQSLGYSVAGGQSFYGTQRLGLLDLAPAPVPEPATLATFGLLVGAAGWRLRRRAA